VEQIEGVVSARILYLYPSTTSFPLIDAIADSPRFQTYYDMPIQHIDDKMLKTMKRGFGEEKTIALLNHMRTKEGAFIRTSLIAGHPNESKESFEKLVGFMEEFGFDRFNTFAYSNEEDTAAYTMKQIPTKTIDSRTKRLGAIAEETTKASLEKMVGKVVTLVIDGVSEEHEYLLTARPLTWAVEIDGEVLVNDTSDIDVEFGRRYQARITELVGTQLLATLIEV
jgi:ribosomal protein S12 methylthiotransferase